jgi:rSAM/selenodomain-associated transferase 1
MNILCIFAKPPIAGKTKKRLAADIGDDAAADLSQIMLNLLISESKSSKADKVFLYIPLEYSIADFQTIDCRELSIRHQKGSDLGQKMSNMFQECCVDNNKVILIGSDCITHTTNTLNEAFMILTTNQIIIQPADDGGYVLIGQSQFCTEIFDGPKWGSSLVFETTIKILNSIKRTVYILPQAFDIDVKADLFKLRTIKNQEIKKWLEKYSF